MKVGIIGASGYGGGELLRILLSHPNVEITYASSREYAGEYIHQVHPNLRGLCNLKFEPPNIEKAAASCSLVFISTPRGVSVKIVPSLLERGIRIIDLGPDFRLKNPKDYNVWYGWEHPNPELLSKAVYGVPEFHRQEIRTASLVACPGCTALASMLALAPAVKATLIDTEKIVVDVQMGSSGAGGKPSLSSHHPERFGVIRPYKPVLHRHTAEIEQELSHHSGGRKIIIAMSAHAVNTVRGILSVAHGFMTSALDIPAIWKVYRSFYQNEPFIRFVRDRKGIYRFPDPKILMGSNYCDIGFDIDPHAQRLVVMAAIDNLVKGSAGIAVQDMNLMLGLDEQTGLRYAGLHPV